MNVTLSRRELIGATAGFLLVRPGRAQGDANQRIGDLLRDSYAKYGLSALLCGVWDGDKETTSIVMGNSMTGIPATKEMHLRVGGVMLTCLCVALLRLVDQGKVKLDDKLSRWMPRLPHADEVTLRMLANCTSGYPDYVRSDKFVDDFNANPFRNFTPQDLIDYAMATPMLYQPGKGWNYSHTNFVILGEALEKATGQSIPDLMRREISRPLKLRETDYFGTAEMRPPVLHAYSLDRKMFEDSTYWNPSWTSHSGLMTSNLRDLGVIARAVGQGTLLSEASRKEQVAPITVGLGHNKSNLYYGMGIIMMNSWLAQNPRFGGYNLFFAHLPARRLSLVIATTKGPKSDPDLAESTKICTEISKILAPDTPLPDLP